jgi:PAS domain S-box-containing protein
MMVAPDAPLALQQALESWDAVLEGLPIGVYVCDADGRILRFNARAAELWGREPALGDSGERFCGSFRVFLPDGRQLPRAETPMADVLRTGKAVRDQEAWVERPDGSRVAALVNIDPILDGEGKVAGAINCFQDVTDLKQAQARMREQDHRLTATFEAALVGIAEIDAEGRRLRVNDAACAITGYSREELFRQTIFDAALPDESDNERTLFRRLVAGEIDRYEIEKRYPRPDTIAWVSVMCSAVRDPVGKFLYAVRVFQDISERKRAEERMQASERAFRDLLAALPAAVYTTDAEGKITFFNEAAAELWGMRPEVGSNWCGSWRLYYPDGSPMPHDQCPMAVALREDRPIRGEEAIAERPDGTRVPFEPYPTPLHDERGRVIGAVNMLIDITERKRAEAEQKALLDELNHRVKNTLATVQSLAAQTIRGSTVPQDVRQAFEARLIALSKVHDQLTRQRWESADLQQIVSDMVEPYRSWAPGGIELQGEHVRLGAQTALTLAMIFHELATNAVKYGSLSSAAGRLSVSWKLTNGGRPPRLSIDWRESGGPAVSKPARRGFGTKLVERGVEQELRGSAQMRFEAAGLHCTMEIPIV